MYKDGALVRHKQLMATIIADGMNRQSNCGSRNGMILGITPNCRQQATTFIEAKNYQVERFFVRSFTLRLDILYLYFPLTFPIQPARSESSGRVSLSFVTKHTFNKVARPCPARISVNNALSTGTRPNNLEAFRIRDSSSSSLPLFFPDGVFLCLSVGVKPCCKTTLEC